MVNLQRDMRIVGRVTRFPLIHPGMGPVTDSQPLRFVMTRYTRQSVGDDVSRCSSERPPAPYGILSDFKGRNAANHSGRPRVLAP